jgi:hypothetical protein
MNYRNLGKELRLFNLKGQGKVKKLEQFLRYLTEFDTKAFVIMDWNKEIHNDLHDFEKMNLLEANHWMV